MSTAPAPTRPPPLARPKPPNGVGHVPQARPTGFSVPEKSGRRPAIILNAVEGWGKTSCAAHADDSVLLLSRGEDGYQTLFEHDRVPARPFKVVSTWPDVLAEIDALAIADKAPSLLALDAIGGFERLCHEHVCATEFKGEWGERGFLGYMRGYETAIPEWLKLLDRLDRYRVKHNAGVLLLSHCRVRPFKNPLGADFDRYVSDVHDKTWGVTHRWADACLFGNFFSVVDSPDAAGKKKGKGIGGTERVIYTERRDAFDAKNRFGMPEQIDIPADPSKAWATIEAAIGGKAGA